MTDLSVIPIFTGLMLDPDCGPAIVRSVMPAHITWLMGMNRDFRAFYAAFRRGAAYRELVMALPPPNRLLEAYYPRLRLFNRETRVYQDGGDLPRSYQAGFPEPITALSQSVMIAFPIRDLNSFMAAPGPRCYYITVTQRELEPIRVTLTNFPFPDADVDELYGLGAELPPYTGEGTDPQVQGRTEYARTRRGVFTTTWNVLRLNGRQYVGERGPPGTFAMRFDFRSTRRGADHAMILVRDAIWFLYPHTRERGLAPLGLEA
jgi:hypothetical protein